jgi:hypothetical protein
MKNKGNIKKLVRNLRVKKNEKLIHIGTPITILKGKKSQKDNI